MKNKLVDIKSPCIRNCCLDEADVCVGCHRALSEILSWSDSKAEEKKAILARCKVRAMAGKH